MKRLSDLTVKAIANTGPIKIGHDCEFRLLSQMYAC